MIAASLEQVSGWRRWGLLVALAALSGCPRDPLPSEYRPVLPKRPSVYYATNRNVDLLFMIDDSSSMKLSQANLARNFPVLMRQLENLPGGLPNIHVAVISSDMGAGDGSIAACDAIGGRNGNFQFTPRGTCAATGLTPGQTFISNIAGVANYTGSLPDVFTCIAALGDDGCGYEQQFAAISRALGIDGKPVPTLNQGFLRPDALLAIVMITNEDDCSAKAASFYDTTSNTSLTSQLGPPVNFRCNEFGHLCDGKHPDRSAPGNDINASVMYSNCTSDENGQLLAVRDIANKIKSLKGDDGQIMVAAIAGPTAPYVVNWRTPSTSDRSCGGASCPWPLTGHSCVAADSSFADPAIRIAELVGHIGDNGRLQSICDDDFTPALGAVGDNIVRYVNAPCILGQIAKRPGTARDDCDVTDRETGGRVPACDDTGGAGECWRLVAGGDSCSGVSVVVQADPQGTEDPPGNLTVRCTMCIPGVPDPAVGCP
jgi:hypothetical protein